MSEAAWSMTLVSCLVDDTLAIGRAMGGALDGGDVLGLVGELGAGKTHLAKGLAVGLGVADDRLVTSPTFVLVNQYAGRCTIHHVDAYRLRSPGEVAAIGFDEMCGPAAVVLVEWADRAKGLMPDRSLWIELTAIDDTTRQLRLTTADPSLAWRLNAAGLDRWRAADDKVAP